MAMFSRSPETLDTLQEWIVHEKKSIFQILFRYQIYITTLKMSLYFLFIIIILADLRCICGFL